MNSCPFPDNLQDDQLLAKTTQAFEENGQVVGALAATPHGRIEFRRDPVVDRRSQRLGVRERVFQLQPRLIETPLRLTEALIHGLRGALDELLVENDDIHDRDRVYLSLASNPFVTLMTDGDSPLLFDNLSKMLNSNEQFELDDSFTLSFVHVRRLPTVTGRKRPYLPEHQASTRLKHFKKCIVTLP